MLAKGQHLFAITAELVFGIGIAGVVGSLEQLIQIELGPMHDAVEHELRRAIADAAKFACDAIK
jgi:hypothetical protein